MTQMRPRASKRIWIGLMRPSVSEAKRLTSKPSAIWKEASSAAGSCEMISSAAKTGRQTAATSKALTNGIGGGFDSSFGIGDERGEAFHFFGEPTDFRIAII